MVSKTIQNLPKLTPQIHLNSFPQVTWSNDLEIPQHLPQIQLHFYPQVHFLRSFP